MKFGMSSYCLTPAMCSGEKTIFDVVDFAAEHKLDHIEFVPFYLPFVIEAEHRLNPELIDAVREKCNSVGVEPSTYSVNADLLISDPQLRRAELDRVKLHIDAAHRLGLKWMRHDIASFRRPFETNTPQNFEHEFPLMLDGVRELYEYADKFGIHTTLENHGFFCNGSDRVIRIIEESGCENLRMTLDVGNFLCVDEPSYAAVKKCIPYAQIIHFKDFYIRDKSKLPGQTEMFNCNNGSWFETIGGKMLRGSIIGQGDIDLWEVAKIIVNSNFNGYVSVEFEGMEECKLGTEISLSMARAILSNS